MNICKECGHQWKFKQRSDCSTNNSRNCPKCFSYCWDFGNNVKCYCCETTIRIPIIHHKDGNHFNNLKENRIAVCKRCHDKIHKLSMEVKNKKIKELRRFL